MTSTILRATATGAALVLALTACGGGSAGGGGDAGSGGSSDDLPVGAIDALYEEVYGGEANDRAAQESMRVEELVAACMAEQGFDYTPVDWTGSGTSSEGPEEEWGTLEFAEKWGYGATTDPWQSDTAPGQEVVDPNQAVVEALSESERAAYEEALYGPPLPEDTDPETYEYDWRTAGCSGSAQHEVYEVSTGMDEAQFEALQEDLVLMDESIRTDPRLAEVYAAWASCMADAGYDGLATPDDAESLIWDQVSAVYEEVDAAAPLGEEATAEEYEAQEADVAARLAELTDEEIGTAVADHTCREETDLARTQAEVDVEYQQEFYDAHQQELDAWRDAVVQGDA